MHKICLPPKVGVLEKPVLMNLSQDWNLQRLKYQFKWANVSEKFNLFQKDECKLAVNSTQRKLQIQAAINEKMWYNLYNYNLYSFGGSVGKCVNKGNTNLLRMIDICSLAWTGVL